MWSNLLFHLAKHWIAGETYHDAINRAKYSNALNISSIINLLGENTTDQRIVNSTTAEYLQILMDIHAQMDLRACISVKPTQLGLNINKTLFKEQLTRIVQTAKSLENFVWLDMEASGHKDFTIEAYLEILHSFDNVGVAIQAYLKRSIEDLNRLLDSGATIRLVKGAYNEPPELVYKRKAQINENYHRLMKVLFERGNRFAIATHDEKLIEEAIGLSRTHSTNFEFEMLMGIRDKKKMELVSHGHRVSEYIPYGKDWWQYSMRRIREHKSNVLLLARSLISS
jgi:proline dehydrogenase